MKRLSCFLLLSFLAGITLGQAKTDPLAIKYYLVPAKDYQQDLQPNFRAWILVGAKRYDLKTTVSINTRAGEINPEIIYNKKLHRNEYWLKTWFAGGGTNFKAWISGSKVSNTASVLVYAQDLDEQAPATKWRLVKAIKL
ncbi:MAG: hypothetical protein U0X40_05745 [Ferruginibacter sp.]